MYRYWGINGITALAAASGCVAIAIGNAELE
jgi:hypothetical protein